MPESPATGPLTKSPRATAPVSVPPGAAARIPAAPPPQPETPPARTPDAAKPAAPPKPTLAAPPEPEPSRGFVVQLGVFTSYANAESLREKLKQLGIESHTETRLQVGPFNERTDAEREMDRFRALGLKPVLVPQR